MSNYFSRFARGASHWLAHPLAFTAACIAVLVWAFSGPYFKYSEDWQLVINTGTTILTFLMVFLIQNTQNRDSRAMQVKLDELLFSMKGARNELIDLENLSEKELENYCQEFSKLQQKYQKALHEKREDIAEEKAEEKPDAKK